MSTFPLIDVSSISNFTSALQNCTALVTVPMLNFSSATTMNRVFRNCSSLVNVPANLFDTCVATDYSFAFVDCALSQTSVDNILVSIDTAGQINGTLNITGGTSSAPSATGLAAKASLEGKGWTVTVNP